MGRLWKIFLVDTVLYSLIVLSVQYVHTITLSSNKGKEERKDSTHSTAEPITKTVCMYGRSR
jgi:hypothetical protein